MDECQLEKPVIVCLCGSMRFSEMFRYVNQRETLAGKIVLAPGCFQGDAVLEVLPGMKQRLDELHLHKIALADEILVVNVGGYIGESTRREIAYARQQGKRIRWLESGTCGDEEACEVEGGGSMMREEVQRASDLQLLPFEGHLELAEQYE